jgi:hypothetical protein
MTSSAWASATTAFLCPRLSTSGGDAVRARRQGGLFGVGRRRCCLDEESPQPDSALAGAAAALAARTLVVARREARPDGERGGGGAAAQVRADLGDEHRCGGLGAAGDGVEQGDDLPRGDVCGARRLDRRGEARDALLQAVNLGKPFGQHDTLVGTQVAPQRLLQLRSSCGRFWRGGPVASSARTAGSASPASRAARMARPEAPMLSVATEATLRLTPSSAWSTRLTRGARSRTTVVRERVRSRTSRVGRGGMHRGSYEAMRQRFGDPLRILDGGLAPGHRLAVPCVEQPDRAGAFEQIADGLPVLAGTLPPVRSRPTGVQPPSVNQSASRSGSPVVVPQVCVSARRAPGVARVRRQTTTVRFRTSMPAQRSPTMAPSCSHTPRCVHGAGRRPTPRL